MLMYIHYPQQYLHQIDHKLIQQLVNDKLLIVTNEFKLVKDLVVTEMSGAIDLGKIPIEVDVGFGNDWLEAH